MAERNSRRSKFSLLLVGAIILMIIVASIGVYFGLIPIPFSLFQPESQTIINGPGGTSILVPPGAAPGATFSINEIDPNEGLDSPEWAENAVSIFDFSVDRPLEGAIFIKIPIPDVELAVLAHYHNGEWRALTFTDEDGKAVVKVENLSLFGWFKINPLKIIRRRIQNYLSLDLPSYYPTTEEILINESQTSGLMSGTATFIGENEVEITVRNDAPITMDIYPAQWVNEPPIPHPKYGSIFPSNFENGLILEPGSEGKWKVKLLPAQSIKFGAEFTPSALWCSIAQVIAGKYYILVDQTLFGRHGRALNLKDAFYSLLPEIFRGISQDDELMSKLLSHLIKLKGSEELANEVIENWYKGGYITFTRPAHWSNVVNLSVTPRCTFALIEFDTRDAANSKLWIREKLGEWTEVFTLKNMLVTHHVWNLGPLKPNTTYEYHLVVEGTGFKWRGKEEYDGNFTTKIVVDTVNLRVVSGEFDIYKGFTVQFEFDTVDSARYKVQLGLTPGYVGGFTEVYDISLTSWMWEETENEPSTHHEIRIDLPPYPTAEYLFSIMECQPDSWEPWMEQSCQMIYLGTIQAPGF